MIFSSKLLYFALRAEIRHKGFVKTNYFTNFIVKSEMSSSVKLINLDEVAENNRQWNYEKPTLCKKGRFTKKVPSKSETFRQKFFELYPALLKLDMQNVIFKGGCVLDIMLGQKTKDLDLFLVGLNSEEAAIARAKQLLEDFLGIEKEFIEKKRENEKERKRILFEPEHFNMDIQAKRLGPVTTLKLSAISIPIQIILVRYDDIAHCLADDDIGATAIAFDGQQIWLNEEAKFALENLTIRVDSLKLTSCGAKRLEKYFDKGFDIVLPQLDMQKLPRHYEKLAGLSDAAILPGLCFSYEKVQGNKIFIDKLLNLPGKEEENEEREDAYKRSANDEDQYVILAENIQKLCANQTDFGVIGQGDYVLNVLKVWPGISARQITNFYNSFERKMLKGSTFDFAVARQYFVMYSVAEIAQRLFANDAKGVKDAAHKLTEKHIARAEAKRQEWLRENAGNLDKLVSINRKEANKPEIFARIYKESKEFYGEYFKADDGQKNKE